MQISRTGVKGLHVVLSEYNCGSYIVYNTISEAKNYLTRGRISWKVEQSMTFLLLEDIIFFGERVLIHFLSKYQTGWVSMHESAMLQNIGYLINKEKK